MSLDVQAHFYVFFPSEVMMTIFMIFPMGFGHHRCYDDLFYDSTHGFWLSSML